jgi:hypothetical protein
MGEEMGTARFSKTSAIILSLSTASAKAWRTGFSMNKDFSF